MINSRAITELTLDAQAWFWRLAAHAEVAGLPYLTDWIVVSTYRDQEQQDALYEQGRTTPGNIVTWTRNSRHTSRSAWDVAFKMGKKILWASPKYAKLADVGRSMGLVVGMDFPGNKVDPAHYEAPETVG